MSASPSEFTQRRKIVTWTAAFAPRIMIALARVTGFAEPSSKASANVCITIMRN